MAERLRRHPLAAVLILEILFDAVTLVGALVLRAAFPTLPGYSLAGPSSSLVLVLVSAGVLLAGIAAFRWWRLAGFTPPAAWRDLRLYWLPVVLLAAPFVAGFRPVALGSVGILVLAYAATALFEEGLWRGAMIGLLRPTGTWRAVLISSALFGLGHLANASLRGASFLIAAQAFGAAVQGVGLAALRLRTNTIWPLIVIHLLHDLFLQLGRLPIPAIEVPIDTILLVYGVIILRGRARELAAEEPEAPVAGRTTMTAAT